MTGRATIPACELRSAPGKSTLQADCWRGSQPTLTPRQLPVLCLKASNHPPLVPDFDCLAICLKPGKVNRLSIAARMDDGALGPVAAGREPEHPVCLLRHRRRPF